jgi:hypothetical protein
VPGSLSESIVGLPKAAIREQAVAFSTRWAGPQREAAEKQAFWSDLAGLEVHWPVPVGKNFGWRDRG